MRRLKQQCILCIYVLLLILLISGCAEKNSIEREIDQLRAGISSLNQRMKVIEEWSQVQIEHESMLTTSASSEDTDSFEALEAEIRQAQVQLHQVENGLEEMTQRQGQLQDLAERLERLESRIEYLMINRDGTQNVKIAPPRWLHKVIWEEDGVVYAVASSTNKTNGREFAVLKAKSALLEYFGAQSISEVQILETYQDKDKTYVLVSKVRLPPPD